jgi:hypothetical protein
MRKVTLIFCARICVRRGRRWWSLLGRRSEKLEIESTRNLYFGYVIFRIMLSLWLD